MKQTTMRQGTAKGGTGTTDAAHSAQTAAPTYPLLRMTLVAMVNLTAAYSTLTWIPTQLIEFSTKTTRSNNSSSSTNTSTNNNSTFQTLPSLSWTLVTLFVFQTLVGLVQAHLHSSASVATRKGASKAGSSRGSSPSLFSVFNISVAIGAIGTLICHVFAVLFGAGIFQLAKETSQFACYLSLLTFYPASFVLGTDLTSWFRIFIHSSPQSYTEAALYCQGMLAIFGAWLGAIVIPLDWDRPWQEWPVPCVLGAVLFYCIGTLVGLVVSIVMRQRVARCEFGISDNAVRSKKGEKKVKDT